MLRANDRLVVDSITRTHPPDRYLNISFSCTLTNRADLEKGLGSLQLNIVVRRLIQSHPSTASVLHLIVYSSDCDSRSDIFFGKHEHGALWLAICNNPVIWHFAEFWEPFKSSLLLIDHFFFFSIHLERGRPWTGFHVTAPQKLAFYYYYAAPYKDTYLLTYLHTYLLTYLLTYLFTQWYLSAIIFIIYSNLFCLCTF